MADYQRISEQFDDGMMIGEATTDKIGFYGATPVVRQTITTLITAGATTTAANAAVAELQVAVSNLGLTTAAA